MDSGQIILAYSRLVLGALAVFFAIILWSKTREPAWMLVVIGIITVYIGIIYSILEALGIASSHVLHIGSISVTTILLSSICLIFFITAFLVKIAGQYRRSL